MSLRSYRRLFNGLLELVDGCTVWELSILNMPVRLPGNSTPYLLRQCLLHTPMAKTNSQSLATWKQTKYLTLLNKAPEPHVTGYICNWDPHCRGILLGAGFLVSPHASRDVEKLTEKKIMLVCKVVSAKNTKTCHLIERRAVCKIATFILRDIQPLHGNPKGVEVGQEEVGVVHEDLVIQVLRVA